MTADIAVGHHWGADVLFLIALIVAALAALAYALATRPVRRDAVDGHTGPAVAVWAPVLGWTAVALLAAAWLIL